MQKSHGWLAAALAASLFTAACEGDDDVVVYRAALFQINPQESLTTASGLAEVIIQGEDNLVEVDLRAVGLDGVGHPSFLWSGNGCPGRAADTNDDGIVDVVEGQVAYGDILLTFDHDVTTQEIEATGFPFGTAPLYGATTTFFDLMDAVDGPDTSENDMFVSLDPGESINLDSRTIVMHGVAPQTVAARSTVTGMAGITVPASVPILCGTLSQVPQ